MIREEDIQKAKDATFPIPEGGRSYEQSLVASGFEMGAHWVLTILKSDGYSDETHWKPSDEPKQEWSEEDESYINNAIVACRSLYGEYSETAPWLKSLNDRMKGKEETNGNL